LRLCGGIQVEVASDQWLVAGKDKKKALKAEPAALLTTNH
jgi:hypothetical protein